MRPSVYAEVPFSMLVALPVGTRVTGPVACLNNLPQCNAHCKVMRERAKDYSLSSLFDFTGSKHTLCVNKCPTVTVTYKMQHQRAIRCRRWNGYQDAPQQHFVLQLLHLHCLSLPFPSQSLQITTSCLRSCCSCLHALHQKYSSVLLQWDIASTAQPALLACQVPHSLPAASMIDTNAVLASVSPVMQQAVVVCNHGANRVRLQHD